MITLMHSTRLRALTTIDAAIFARVGENRRAAYAAADRRDAEAMYARTDAVGETNADMEHPGQAVDR
jgi:hypothetical protein